MRRFFASSRSAVWGEVEEEQVEARKLRERRVEKLSRVRHTRMLVRWILFLSMVPIAWLSLEVLSVIDFKVTLATAAEYDASVRYQGVVMTKRDFVSSVLIPKQEGAVTCFFFEQSLTTLRVYLYVLLAMAGGVAFYWLRIAGFDRGRAQAGDFEINKVIARILCSAFAGAIVFFLLRLPAPLLVKVFSLGAAADVHVLRKTDTLYDSMIALPLLSGLFASAFYEQMRDAFAGLFGK